MATLINNPFGEVKGVLGNNFYRTRNGKTILVPRSKRKKNNNSEGELCRKRKFSITSSFSKHVCRLNLLKEVWGKSRTGCYSSFHEICRCNYGYSSASRPTERNIITPEGFPVTISGIILNSSSLSFQLPELKNFTTISNEESSISVNVLITFFDSFKDEAGPFDIIELTRNIEDYDFEKPFSLRLDFDDEQRQTAQNYKQFLLHAAVITITDQGEIAQHSSTFAYSGIPES